MRLRFLFGIFFCMAITLRAAIPPQPDSDTLKKIELGFPDWKKVASERCAVLRGSDLWAWKVVLERSVSSDVKSEAPSRKGYIVIVLVPDAGIDPGKEFIDVLDWHTPDNDLKQYVLYLGRGRGYHWYMKSDAGRLMNMQEYMKLTGGEDMNSFMAKALNVIDYDLFTSRVAVEYFRGRGNACVPLILNSARLWQMEENTPPIQHLYALKLIGTEEAGKALITFAASKDFRLAHQALKLLVEEPYLASDGFYRRLLKVPAYTDSVIKVFRARQKGAMLIPDLQQILKEPKSIGQYTAALAAVREFQAGKKFTGLPEYQAVNDIMFLMMRMGETPETFKYIPLDSDGKGTTSKLDDKERQRIAPHLEIVRKSKDFEVAFAAALALASFSSEDPNIAKSYKERVRKTGLELLRGLPAEMVYEKLALLEKNLRDTKEQANLRRLKREFGEH